MLARHSFRLVFFYNLFIKYLYRLNIRHKYISFSSFPDAGAWMFLVHFDGIGYLEGADCVAEVVAGGVGGAVDGGGGVIYILQLIHIFHTIKTPSPCLFSDLSLNFDLFNFKLVHLFLNLKLLVLGINVTIGFCCITFTLALVIWIHIWIRLFKYLNLFIHFL